MSRGILKYITVMAALSVVCAASSAQDYGAPVPRATSASSTTSHSGGDSYGAPVPRYQPQQNVSDANYGAPVPRARATTSYASPVEGPPVPAAAPVAAPSAREDRQQRLEATDGVECVACQKKDAADELDEELERYARNSSRSWTGHAIARVMGALYQRCDADKIFVTPGYYSKALHNADERANAYHGYRGSSSIEPYDMMSGNDEPSGASEWISYRIASQSDGLIYNQDSYAPGCRDMRVHPVAFREGRGVDAVGRSLFGRADDGQMTVNMFNSNATPAAGADAKNFTTTDCSNFVKVILAAEGYRIYKTGPANVEMTTSTLINLTHPNPNACIGPAQLTPRESIKSGDIIVYNAHHSMVVDRVGDDPFGLEKMPAGSSCQDLDPKNFDIDLVQSGLFGGRLGPEHVRMADLLAPNSMIQERQNALLVFAMKACEAKRTGVSISAAGSGATLLRPVGMADSKCYVHKPATHPDCVRDPGGAACKSPWGAKLKGEECLANCTFGDGGSGSGSAP